MRRRYRRWEWWERLLSMGPHVPWLIAASFHANRLQGGLTEDSLVMAWSPTIQLCLLRWQATTHLFSWPQANSIRAAWSRMGKSFAGCASCPIQCGRGRGTRRHVWQAGTAATGSWQQACRRRSALWVRSSCQLPTWAGEPNHLCLKLSNAAGIWRLWQPGTRERRQFWQTCGGGWRHGFRGHNRWQLLHVWADQFRRDVLLGGINSQCHIAIRQYSNQGAWRPQVRRPWGWRLPCLRPGHQRQSMVPGCASAVRGVDCICTVLGWMLCMRQLVLAW